MLLLIGSCGKRTYFLMPFLQLAIIASCPFAVHVREELGSTFSLPPCGHLGGTTVSPPQLSLFKAQQIPWWVFVCNLRVILESLSKQPLVACHVLQTLSHLDGLL